MSALSVNPPFPIFLDIDGQPLDAGYIYLGVANQATEANPIQAYWDAALSVPATQPILTKAGFPVNAGVPARVYVNSDYSIVVKNRNGFQVFSSPIATDRFNDAVVNIDSSDVTFLQAGTGAVARTAQAKMRDAVSVKDFDGDIAKAVDSLPATGGIVHLEAEEYISPYQGTYFGNPSIMTKAHVVFQGAGKPTYNSTYSKLEGGTVIKGSFFFAADGVEFRDLGIDVGKDFCDANYSGAPREGLIGIDRANAGVPGFAGGDPSKQGFVAQNIAILAHKTGKPGDTSDVHALLLENYVGWKITNIDHVMGGAGLVIKSSRGSMDGAYCRGSYKYAVLNKSEAYSAASFNTYSNIVMENLLDATPDPTVSADYDTTGFVVEAATANAEMITISNVIGNGVINGVIVRGLSTYEVQNCLVADGQFINTDSYVAFTDGITRNVVFDSLHSRNSSLGIWVQSASDSTGVSNCLLEDVIGGYPYRSDAPNTRLISCASTDPVAQHIYVNGGTTYVMGGFRAVGGTGLSLAGAGTLYGATDYSVSTTSTGEPAFLIGPTSGAMAANDFTSLGFKVRNSAGGAVASGDGIGAELQAYQPGTGTNQAGLDVFTRPSSSSFRRSARFDEQGNLYFRVNQTGTGTTPALFENQQVSFELVNNTTLKIYMRGTDGVTRSADITVA